MVVQERIFVTGGSGFVGSAVIAELRRRDFAVTALVNKRPLQNPDPAVSSVSVDLFDPAALANAMAGCAAVLHLIGIIIECPAKGITFQHMHIDATRAVVQAAAAANVPRFIYLSALGARPDPTAAVYHQTKFAAEELVRNSDLHWTILRPSVIHGPRGDFMKQEAKWARKKSLPFLFMPYFGKGWLGQGGAGKIQPIYVDDIARALVDAINNPATVDKAYDLCGDTILTWPQLHRIVSQTIVGHARWVFPVPVPLAKFYATIGLAPLLGFNRDQIQMSQENSTADLEPFITDFGWRPRPFDTTLGEYAKQL